MAINKPKRKYGCTKSFIEEFIKIFPKIGKNIINNVKFIAELTDMINADKIGDIISKYQTSEKQLQKFIIDIENAEKADARDPNLAKRTGSTTVESCFALIEDYSECKVGQDFLIAKAWKKMSGHIKKCKKCRMTLFKYMFSFILFDLECMIRSLLERQQNNDALKCAENIIRNKIYENHHEFESCPGGTELVAGCLLGPQYFEFISEKQWAKIKKLVENFLL